MSIIRRVARNFSWLLGGRAAAALLTLAATVLTARSLGTEAFGLIILVHTTALIIRQLCSIKSTNAIIHFGVPLLSQQHGDKPANAAWRHLIGGLRRLDMLGALTASLAGAALLAFVALPLGLVPELRSTAWLYVVALLCTGTGTARGALRSMDRYRLLSMLLLAGPTVRLMGVTLCAATEAPASNYLLAWASGLLVDQLSLLISAARILGRPYLGMAASAALKAQPGLSAFLKLMYWQSNLDLFPRRVATLAVGGLFGAEGAGIYRLARDVAEVGDKPVLLLRQAIFPDLSRLWQDDRAQFLPLVWRVSTILALIGGGLFLIALAYGGELLALLAGEEFRAGAPLLALLLAAGALDLGGAPLRPASYAMGKAHAVFRLQAFCVAAFFATLFATAPASGLASAGWAALMGATLSLGGMVVLVRRVGALGGERR